MLRPHTLSSCTFSVSGLRVSSHVPSFVLGRALEGRICTRRTGAELARGFLNLMQPTWQKHSLLKIIMYFIYWLPRSKSSSPSSDKHRRVFLKVDTDYFPTSCTMNLKTSFVFISFSIHILRINIHGLQFLITQAKISYTYHKRNFHTFILRWGRPASRLLLLAFSSSVSCKHNISRHENSQILINIHCSLKRCSLYGQHVTCIDM